MREGRILHDDWRLYTAWNAVIKHKMFTPEQLEENFHRVYREIYSPEMSKKRAQYFRKICVDLVNEKADDTIEKVL